MVLLTTEFLFSAAFSAVFILIGSLAFHISALISGDNIYRELSTQEATLLSIVAGIVIFLLSPISFIISPFTDYADISVRILNFKVLLAFFGGAFGLGLIFGCVTILKARVNILDWFRDKSGMGFWIYSYGITWDDFLLSVKRKGEIFVQTDDEMFKGLLKSLSIRDETREIVLGKPKIKRDGGEEEPEGEENAGLLIPGSKIKRIIVPERSFRKHFESMGHISQAFYCIFLAIGFFLLSCSAYLTENYMQNLELASKSLASLESFYGGLSLIFSVLALIILCVSVWVAKKDFDNWRPFLVLSPAIVYVALFFSLIAILLIIFITQILQVLILIFVLLSIALIYIKFGNWVKKPRESIKATFYEIKGDFNNDQKLEKVIQSCYLQLSCNNKNKAHIRDIEAEILKKYENDENVRSLVTKLNTLKENTDCLKEEDFNIILAFMHFIKKEKG